MGTRKSTTPRKAATPKKAKTSPEPVRVRAGSPPGSVGDDAVERLVTQWLRQPKHPADYIRLPRALLMEDARTVMTGRDDLEAFEAAGTPIREAAFDYLDVLVRKVGEVTAPPDPRARALPDTPRVAKAMDGVGRALRDVLARAEAGGRAVRRYELSRGPATPALFIAQVLHVVQSGRRRVEKWDDPMHAMKLFRALEEAALELESAWKLTVTGAPASDSAMRGLALDRLLFDAMVYLAAFGRAVFPEGDDRHEAYRLKALFPDKARGLRAPLDLVDE